MNDKSIRNQLNTGLIFLVIWSAFNWNKVERLTNNLPIKSLYAQLAKITSSDEPKPLPSQTFTAEGLPLSCRYKQHGKPDADPEICYVKSQELSLTIVGPNNRFYNFQAVSSQGNSIKFTDSQGAVWLNNRIPNRDGVLLMREDKNLSILIEKPIS